MSFLANSASIKLHILCQHLLLFSPSQTLALYTRSYPPLYGICPTCMGVFSLTALLNRIESKAFRFINSPPPTDRLQLLKDSTNIASLAIFCAVFIVTVLFEIANSMSSPPSRDPAAELFFLLTRLYSVHYNNIRINQHLLFFIPLN